MSMNLNNVAGGGKKFGKQPNLTPGTYPGRVVQVIALGLQPQRPFKGQDKPPAYELSITYELVDEFMKDEEGNDMEGKPRWVSESFPLRNLQAENAKSTARYNVFDPDGTKFGGDISKIINQPCNVTIINNKNGDKVYDNVANVSAMRARDAEKCPELKNPPVVFDIENPDAEVFKKFPKWLQEKIVGNLEFQGSKLQAIVQNLPKEVDNTPKEQVKAESQAEQDNNPY